MEANMMASGTGAGSMDKVSTLVQPTSSTMDLRLQQEKCERPWLVLWIQWCFGWWIRMCHFHTFKLWYPKKVFVPPRSLGRWKASRKRNSGFLGTIKLRSKVLHLCCFSLFLFFKINSACFCGMARIFGEDLWQSKEYANGDKYDGWWYNGLLASRFAALFVSNLTTPRSM